MGSWFNGWSRYLAGGALGAAASREKLKGGTFFQEDRKSLERELGAFGSRNIVGGLKAGITAGIGQAGKLRKARIKGKGLDFKGSFVGRGLEKGKAEGLKQAEQLSLMSEGKAPGVFKQTTTGNEFIDRSLGVPTKTGVFDDVGGSMLEGARYGAPPKVDPSFVDEDTFSIGSDIGDLDELGNMRGYDNYTLANQTSIRPGSKLGFSTFDEGSWAEGEKALKSVDFQQSLGTIERLGLPGSSGYGRSGLRSSIPDLEAAGRR